MKTTTTVIHVGTHFNRYGRKCLLEQPIDIKRKGERISKRALRMANAIVLEELLMEGRFENIGEALKYLGISRYIWKDCAAMLNLPPEEITRILFKKF